MHSIGGYIAEARKQAGLTQEELALRVGYKSKSTINKIEQGTRDLPQKKIAAFADALGVTPAKLMGWEEERKEKTGVAVDIVIRLGNDPEFCEAVKLLYRLEPKQLSGVKNMLESLAS